MPRKKKESLLEKAEEVIKEPIEKLVEGLKEETKEMLEEVKEAVSGEKPKKSKIKKEARESKEKKEKFAEVLKKAKELEATVEESEKIDIRKKLIDTPIDDKDLLVPLNDYMKSSIHLGTRVITPDIRPFVYRRRADGLAIFNTSLLDKKMREGADYLTKFSPEQIIIVCKREAGWAALEKFSQLTGIRIFTKKYPPGILTNSNLKNFIEADLVFVVDPWIDKNAFNDAKKMKIPIMSICDSNNYSADVDAVIIGNNKSSKSLGMIFYLLAKTYKEKRNLDFPDPAISEFISDWDNLQSA